ncbi:hypothetical protein LG201_02205 [Methylobacillus gramineus]|uniref:hypothetical protein n=1 Tax=Methylobacillus gramineus TaxID=755169 RepID=UPI001CFF825F|nr:hypothetical protein [Methylobacillus gramineus]MCB5184014.1 hypothetical protein [Methylobacillus gramineus]
MADANFTSSQLSHIGNNVNIKLGRALFSNPQRDKHSAVMTSNVQDVFAGIKVQDLVRVDFTVNKIYGDGLYVITLDDNWIGYRRFQYSPKLKIVSDGTSYLVTDELMKSIKIVGLVLDIYRSTREE